MFQTGTVDGGLGAVWDRWRDAAAPWRDLAAAAADGWRILRSSRIRRRRGPLRYAGTAEEICEQVVRACVDPVAGYLRTSRHSYPELYARDFGRCAPALVALGLGELAERTYRYALDHYERVGRFALIIAPSGAVFDFPAYAPDGFAFFMHGLSRLPDRAVWRRSQAFLRREVQRFVQQVIDPSTGLARADRVFSEAQDYARRRSSCYTNAVCFLLQQTLQELDEPNPLARYSYAALFEAHFWRGDHCADDLRAGPYVSGDAQVLPFWAGVWGFGPEGRRRFEAALAAMEAAGLNDPLPSRYGAGPHPARRMHLLETINPWQTSAVWTCLGLHLLETLARFAHPSLPQRLQQYAALVERMGCFPEVLDPTSLELLESPVMLAEDSMSWAVNLWALLRTTRTGRTEENQS